MLTLAPDAAEAFAEITRTRVGDVLAIVLDGRVLTAPRINGVIDEGRIQIEGVTTEEAESVATAIRDATGAETRQTVVEADPPFDVSTPGAAAMTFADANGRRDWLRSARALHPRTLAFFRDEAREELVLVDGEIRMSLDRTAEPALEPVAVGDVLGENPGATWTDFSDAQTTALYFARLAGTWTLSGGRDMVHVGTLPDGLDAATVVLRPSDEFEAYYEGIGMASPIVLRVERVADGWRVLYPTIGQQWQPMRDPGIAPED